MNVDNHSLIGLPAAEILPLGVSFLKLLRELNLSDTVQTLLWPLEDARIVSGIRGRMCDFVGTNNVLCKTVSAYVQHDILFSGDSSYEIKKCATR